MPNFEDHISQAQSNLRFLHEVNSKISDAVDWQVTVSFYTALHFVNAHLAKYDLHYRKHVDVDHAISFENSLSVAKLPQDVYLSYKKLQSLSRRSRYLVNSNVNPKVESAHLTYSVHFAKALRHLDKLLYFFDKKYALNLNLITVNCIDLKQDALTLIKLVKD